MSGYFKAAQRYQRTQADWEFLNAVVEEGKLTYSQREARAVAAQLGMPLERLRIIVNNPNEATSAEVVRLVGRFPGAACAVPFPFLVDSTSNERIEPTLLERSIIIGTKRTLPALAGSCQIPAGEIRGKLSGARSITYREALALLAAVPNLDRETISGLVLGSLQRPDAASRLSVEDLSAIAKGFPEIKREALSSVLIPENPTSGHLAMLLELLAFELCLLSIFGVATRLGYSTERISYLVRTKNLPDLFARMEANSIRCSEVLCRALERALGIWPGEGFKGSDPSLPELGTDSSDTRPKVPEEGVRQSRVFLRRERVVVVIAAAPASPEAESVDDALLREGFAQIADLEDYLGVPSGILKNFSVNSMREDHPAVVRLRGNYPRIYTAMVRGRSRSEK